MSTLIKTSGIYKITNLLNGKFYIGSSYDIIRRWKQHRYNSTIKRPNRKSILYDAMQKYGVENFIFEILEETDSDKETLCKVEQHFIEALSPEYNLIRIASVSRFGQKASLETRALQRGRPRKIETTEKWKVSSKAFWKSPEGLERRQKFSDDRKGKFNGLVGYKHSPEILKRLSEARKGKKLGKPGWSAGLKLGPHSEEWNENIGKAQKGIPKPHLAGIPRTDEVKQKIAEAQTGVPRYYSRGKPSGNSSHGHYGLSWRKDLNKWTVRLQDKKYGNFINLEDALHRRDEIMNSPAYIAANEPKNP